MNILELSDDVLLCIFQRLSLKDIASVARCCKFFSKLTRDDGRWMSLYQSYMLALPMAPKSWQEAFREAYHVVDLLGLCLRCLAECLYYWRFHARY